MSERISRNPERLRDQITMVPPAITGVGAQWPSAAPTTVAVTTSLTTLNTAINSVATLEAQLKVARQTLNTSVKGSVTVMKQIDAATDLLYTPAGAQKTNFGLPPKGVTPLPPLAKLTDLRTADGPKAGSIFFKWESIAGATYEVKWFADYKLNMLVGSDTVTRSELTVYGLTSGSQYWLVVRPVRGGQYGAWSDAATRVACV